MCVCVCVCVHLPVSFVVDIRNQFGLKGPLADSLELCPHRSYYWYPISVKDMRETKSSHTRLDSTGSKAITPVPRRVASLAYQENA